MKILGSSEGVGFVRVIKGEEESGEESGLLEPILVVAMRARVRLRGG